MHIYLQTVSEIEDPLWLFSSDWNRTLPRINSSGTQKYSITQLLMCAAENSRTHPNWKRINSAVCWSSSLRKQRSLAAAPIACRRAPYEQEQFSGYNLEDLQLEKILESRCMRRFIQSIMNGLRYSWNRLHPQTQLLKSNSNNGFNIKTTQNQLSNRQTLRINIEKPSKSTVNVKIATETVFVLISGWTIPLMATQKDISQASRTEHVLQEWVSESVRICAYAGFWRLLQLLPRSLIVNHTETQPDMNNVTSILKNFW